jgi:RNA polymerase sigma-70 factor, ECF subfamily
MAGEWPKAVHNDDLADHVLIQRCRSGDDGAFGELVAKHQNLVYGLIYRLAADRTQAEDLAQDVFLRIHRGLPYFRGEARLSTWIYRIVQHVCFETRGKRRVAVSIDQPRGDGRPRFEPGGADAAFADMELRDRLEKAMAKLPEHYRFLIAAHYLKGVQYEALAESLNLPLGTIKTHVYRAKRRLRELLDT